MHHGTQSRSSLTLVLLLLCSIGTILNILAVRDWGDGLSMVDAFSEANAIRESHEFLDRGLWVHHGLGNVLYGDLYPDAGLVADPEARSGHVEPDGVYTHYPPGPEYLLYASMKLLGPTPVSRLRAVPILFSWIATTYFGFSLARRFGLEVAAIVIAACTALPTFYDANSELHLIGYACALILVEIGICFRLNNLAWPFFVLGFFQGWLSFDYGLLAISLPIAVEVALPRLCPGAPLRLRLALWRMLAVGVGFALAHLLHFAEVVTYFGSLSAAVHDMHAVAVNRSGEGTRGIFDYIAETATTLYLYWFGDVIWPLSLIVPREGVSQHLMLFNRNALHFLGLSFGSWWLCISAVLLVARIPAFKGARWSSPILLIDWAIVCLCGFIPCSLWLVVMKNHARVHQHLLFRHMFLAFLLTTIFVVQRLLREEVRNRQAPERAVVAITT